MSRFSDYVTNVGFRIELTKAQLRLFAAVAKRSEHRLVLDASGAATERNLVMKGLIEFEDGGRYLVLTKEGELLRPLLSRAGLLDIEAVRIKSLMTPEELAKETEV